jgi:hypothetical protein
MCLSMRTARRKWATVLALIDESAPATVQGVHYVISSAVIIDVEDLDHARDRIRKVTAGRKNERFHWSREGVEKREAMVTRVGELCDGMYTVIHHPVQATQQRAARRAALSTLMRVLADNGVPEAWIESRGPQDQADRQVILDGQRDGWIPSGFSYSFFGKGEPLLWLPDAVAGAYSQAEIGKGDQYLLRLQQSVTEIDVRRHGPLT